MEAGCSKESIGPLNRYHFKNARAKHFTFRREFLIVAQRFVVQFLQTEGHSPTPRVSALQLKHRDCEASVLCKRAAHRQNADTFILTKSCRARMARSGCEPAGPSLTCSPDPHAPSRTSIRRLASLSVARSTEWFVVSSMHLALRKIRVWHAEDLMSARVKHFRIESAISCLVHKKATPSVDPSFSHKT